MDARRAFPQTASQLPFERELDSTPVPPLLSHFPRKMDVRPGFRIEMVAVLSDFGYFDANDRWIDRKMDGKNFVPVIYGEI